MKQTHYRAIIFCTYIPIIIYLLGYLLTRFVNLPSWLGLCVILSSFSLLIVTLIACIFSLIQGIKLKDWNYILLGILPLIIFYLLTINI